MQKDTGSACKAANDPSSEMANEEAGDKSEDNKMAKENNRNAGTNNTDSHEDSVNSHDGMDIDMNDIVVIDEYDSTKNDGKLSERKKNEPKVDNEREMRYLEKRYRLPENPHILVHASKSSKLEKFNCEMMSLSILLDYRPEDNKKHSFEVSLFAELFNEMLTRDFGFNIYKAFYLAPDEQCSEKESEKTKKDKDDSLKPGNEEPKEKKSRKDNEAVSSREKEAKEKEAKEKEAKEKEAKEKEAKEKETKEKEAKEKDNSNAEDNQSESGRKSSKDTTVRPKEKESNKEREKDREHKERDGRDRENRDRDRDRRERRVSRRDEDTDDDNHSIRSGDVKRREHKKMRTVDPDLLLSFVYFDQGHCGYIFSNHIEELFYALGLQLSRGEVKKLVTKLTARTLLYRKLTDKPIDEITKEQGECSNDVINKLKPNTIEIGKGNTALLPVFQDNRGDKNNAVNTSPSTSESNETKSELITYKGALIDIEKTMNQMKRSEAARANIEQRLVELTKTNQDLELSAAKTKEKLKDLQSDLKSSNRKLHDAEQSLSSTTRKNSEYYSILLSIHDRVTPAVMKNEQRTRDRKDTRDRDEKEKEKNADRDASKDNKNNEKHRTESKEPEIIKKKEIKVETKENE